jgi:hypothetical protein
MSSVPLLLSCDSCVMQHTATCADCVVTHLLSPAPVEPVAWSDAELRAVSLLAKAGLVPTLRHHAAHQHPGSGGP